MAGKFLRRGAIVDLIKSRERTNAIQKRGGFTRHPVRRTVCGCPDPDCGGWHRIITEVTEPTDEECVSLLKQEKATRKNIGRDTAFSVSN
jgi:hypothetical protein